MFFLLFFKVWRLPLFILGLIPTIVVGLICGFEGKGKIGQFCNYSVNFGFLMILSGIIFGILKMKSLNLTWWDVVWQIAQAAM